MISPVKKDIGRRIKYTDTISYSSKTSYGELVDYSDTIAYCYWDGEDHSFMKMSFLSELEWDEKKKK